MATQLTKEQLQKRNFAIANAILKALMKAEDRYPDWGPGFPYIRFVASDKIDTMGIRQDGVCLYNPEFTFNLCLDKNDRRLHPANMVELVVHEFLHVWFNHHKRKLQHRLNGQLSHDGFNIAMDAEINSYLLSSEWICKSGITPQTMQWPPNLSMEQYADMLWKDMRDQKKKYPDRYNSKIKVEIVGNDNSQKPRSGANPPKSGKASRSKGQSGQSCSSNQPGPVGPQGGSSQGGQPGGSQSSDDGDSGSEASSGSDPVRSQMTTKERIIDNLIFGQKIKELFDQINMDKSNPANTFSDRLREDVERKLMEGSKSRGTETGCYGSELSRVKKIVYPWQIVLQNLVATFAENKAWGFDRFSYKRPNKRWAAVSPDVVHPNYFSEELNFRLVVAVDISGSMGPLVKEMYSRLRSLTDSLGEDSKTYVMEVDMEIERVVEDFDCDVPVIKTGAGGGTDMGVVNTWVMKQIKDGKMEMPDAVIIMTDNYTPWDPVIRELKDRTIVLTPNVSDECPYRQIEVLVDKKEESI